MGKPLEGPSREVLPPQRHYVSSDTDILTVDVPITAHSEEVLQRRLRLTQNEITSASGAFAGFLSGLAVCPLDVAKTRFQAQGAYLKALDPAQVAVYDSKKYRGVFQSLGLIYKEEGVRGLYRGVVPITLGYFPTWMVYFTCYDHFKPFYLKVTGNNENLTYFASAISSGAISTTLTNPIWVVKTRLMLQMGRGRTIYDRFRDATPGGRPGTNPGASLATGPRAYYTSTLNAFVTMYRAEGLGVFYKGLIPSYFGLVHVAIQFPLYENFKKVLGVREATANTRGEAQASPRGEGPSQFLRLILASCLSKMIASAITYPHEIVRTRMQLAGAPEPQLRALARVVGSILTTEGPRGFYSGFAINLARTVPASAVTLVSFEYFKRALQVYAV